MISTANSAGGKPRLMITDSAVEDLVTEVVRFPDHENAFGIVGLTFANGSMVITGIIPPASMDIVRRESTAKFGGDDLAAAVEWMDTNYSLLHPDDKDQKAEFTFFWKGHTHQQIRYPHYSSTDFQSILDAVKKYGMDKVVGVLGLIDRKEGSMRSEIVKTGVVAKELKRLGIEL